MEFRERGWSVDAAAREVGVSRTAGRNWAYGYKTYRSGQVVGFVPALDRLAVREINARFLSQDERIEIADLHHAGVSMREIARQAGHTSLSVVLDRYGHSYPQHEEALMQRLEARASSSRSKSASGS